MAAIITLQLTVGVKLGLKLGLKLGVNLLVSLVVSLLVVFLVAMPGQTWAATYVYVSNAQDGDIATYALHPDGRLTPGRHVPAGALVMPMAVSPDSRYLFAGLLSKPYRVISYRINRRDGSLSPIGSASLAAAYPYLSVDQSGRFLLGASYGGDQVGVNAIWPQGRVSNPLQVMATARNAHAIVNDQSNRFAFAPHLGTDQIFQFKFDPNSGMLSANSPAAIQLTKNTGPRHLVISADNRFAYLLNEFTGSVTLLLINPATGKLTELESVSSLPPDSPLIPGGPRDGGAPRRQIGNKIWASDLHLTPDGRFLYTAERTGSTISAFAVNRTDGSLRLLSTTPTERQPRGFAIEPNGKFLVAAGEMSSTISVYSIDSASGSLALMGRYPSGKGANWVQIVDTSRRLRSR